ncbi:MAG: YczE/YyaS/YitT family protein [Chloroflexota bacterium]
MPVPNSSGGWWIGWPRFSLLLIGPFIISLGFTMNIQANVGQGPWQAFHVGISLQTPLTIGMAGQVVSVSVLALAWLLGVRPGIGTALNIALGGIIQDILIYNHIIPEMHDVVTGYAMMLAGAVVMGLGTALYVKAQIGAGPRDSLMVALSRRLQRDVGPVRVMMDGLAVFFGWLMGAPIGLGTVVFVITLGPILSFWFRVLNVPVRRSKVPPQVEPSHQANLAPHS